MKRILVPTKSAADWQALLADPVKHWRTGYSAKTLAHAWEAAKGMPPEVRTAFRQSALPELRQLDLLLAIPEYQTDLPGGRRPSCTDLFVLARSSAGLVAIAVEGKVGEDFGPLYDDWIKGASAGKRARWQFIERTLGLNGLSATRLRYQLFHRTVSAVLEAKRFGARDAVMLVHCFGPKPPSYGDFEAFVEFMGGVAAPGKLVQLVERENVRLHAAWVRGHSRYLAA